jgi:hypothetical protein
MTATAMTATAMTARVGTAWTKTKRKLNNLWERRQHRLTTWNWTRKKNLILNWMISLMQQQDQSSHRRPQPLLGRHRRYGGQHCPTSLHMPHSHCDWHATPPTPRAVRFLARSLARSLARYVLRVGDGICFLTCLLRILAKPQSWFHRPRRSPRSLSKANPRLALAAALALLPASHPRRQKQSNKL